MTTGFVGRDAQERRLFGRRLGGSVMLVAAGFLAGCDGAQMPGFLQPKSAEATSDDSMAVTRAGTLVERDVEAPEVFQATEAGLWDGRPSLGGVWAAHPDVTDPERIIIRNETNGKFVIGALFRRERETPGPRLQISSDAAAALGMLAGQPTNLNVVALRREEAPETDIAPAATMPAPAEVSATPLDAGPSPDLDTLDPVAATAAAALEDTGPDADVVITASAAPAASAPVVTAAPRNTASRLDKPYLQIGIFSVETNAQNTAAVMRQAGMVPTVLKQSSSGKTFWRVIIGPAQNKSERDTLLTKIKTEGFTDAYPVTN